MNSTTSTLSKCPIHTKWLIIASFFLVATIGESIAQTPVGCSTKVQSQWCTAGSDYNCYCSSACQNGRNNYQTQLESLLAKLNDYPPRVYIEVETSPTLKIIMRCNTPIVPDCSNTPDAAECSNDNDCEGTANTDEPIVLSSGRKFLNEKDFSPSSIDSLSFSRRFNYTPGLYSVVQSYRDNWTFGRAGFEGESIDFERRDKLFNVPDAFTITAVHSLSMASPLIVNIDDNPRLLAVAPDDSVTDNDLTLNLQVEKILNSGQTANNWKLINDKGIGKEYDAIGRLITLTAPSGYTQVVNYNSTLFELDDYTITDSNNRQLTFAWQDADHAVMTTPTGEQFHYIFDDLAIAGPTLTVYYPDATPADLTDNDKREYIHIASFNPDTTPALLNGALKEIRDNGVLTLSYEYDPVTGYAIHSNRNNGVSDVNEKNITYSLNGNNRVDTATLTNPLNKDTVYHFDTVNSSQKLVRTEGVTSSSCAASDSYYDYDAYGYRKTATDALGNVTETVRDYRGLVLTERNGLSWSAGPGSTLLENTESEKIETQWHTLVQKPLLRTYYKQDDVGAWQAYLEETYGYDPDNYRLTTLTRTDKTNFTVPYNSNGRTQAWSYTYTYWDVDKVVPKTLTIDGPRTDLTDSVTNSYSDGTDANHSMGDFLSTTNALGQVTLINSLDGAGRITSMTDPNGVETTMTYTYRGWIDTVTVENGVIDAVTDFTYDNHGQISDVTLPHGVSVHYDYDSAQRLYKITDNSGAYIEYTLDNAGNILFEKTFDNSAVIKRNTERVFDELSRLRNTIGTTDGQEDLLDYDVNDNLASSQVGGVNGNNPVTRLYDALDRVKQIDHADGGASFYKYDAFNNITEVKDQNNLITTYQYDGLSNLMQVVSPDTGTTSYTYDNAGNRLSETDARVVVTQYSYDALNRLTGVNYPATPSENVTYSFDDVINSNKGIGHLTGLSDPSGSNAYGYNALGQLVSKTTTIESTAYSWLYEYNLVGDLMKIIYPSDREVRYERNTLGQISAVYNKDNASATEVLIANTFNYLPFGPLNSYTFGNGVVQTIGFDTDYRVNQIDSQGALGILDLGYNYKITHTIDTITDSLDNTQTQAFSYDDENRLTTATGGYGTLDYNYDLTGNRTQRTLDNDGSPGIDITETYGYNTANSNQLNSLTITGEGTHNFAYNSSGALTSDPRTGATLGYNDANRLVSATGSPTGAGNYLYNGLGQRVVKLASPALTTSHYHYTEQGQLLAEYDDTGSLVGEYIYADGERLAYVVTGAPNVPPIADAGADVSADENDPVTLDGSNSSDSDGSIATYSWTQILGPAVSVNNATLAVADFVAPNVATSTVLGFELTVTDDSGDSTADQIDITVVPNVAPVEPMHEQTPM